MIQFVHIPIPEVPKMTIIAILLTHLVQFHRDQGTDAYSNMLFTLFVHILSVACIHHCHGLAVERVGIVPLVGICHVVTNPSGNNRLPPQERPL